jgi:hypothetical protein
MPVISAVFGAMTVLGVRGRRDERGGVSGPRCERRYSRIAKRGSIRTLAARGQVAK